ncbi:hypothetical protein Aperf_G00000070110 [Anoplocephala perfoliata]
MYSAIITVSVQGSASQNFYSIVDSLYAPLLLKCEDKIVCQFPRLQMALNELIIGLSSISKLHSSANDEEDTVMFDIASEAEYWLSKSKSPRVKHRSDRQAAESIYKHLKPAADATQQLQLQIDSVVYQQDESGEYLGFLSVFTETLESTVLNSLDDVWRLPTKSAFTPYPETRMSSLIEAITGWICRILMSYLSPINGGPDVSPVWSRMFKQMYAQLSGAIQLCGKWEKSCQFFISHLWARDESHRWKGDLPSFTYFQNFQTRLKDILEICCIYHQLTKVLNSDEHARLGLSQGLDDFLRKNMSVSSPTTDPSPRNSALSYFVRSPLAYSPCSVTQWNAAMNIFSEKIRVIEDSAIPHLRLSLSSANVRFMSEITFKEMDICKVAPAGNSSIAPQVILEFQRFGELYKRPTIAKALQADREILLGFIDEAEKAIREEFMNHPADGAEGGLSGSKYVRHGRNLPDQVDKIVWASQLEGRIAEYVKLAECVLYDLPNCKLLKEKLEALTEEISQWRKDQFHTWCRQTLAAIDGNDGDGERLALDTSRSLLHISTLDGQMRVGYPEELVRLQREVRLLAGLGYSVPPRLHTVATQAETLYRHAIILKQIAHFYNSIDGEMLPCQQALMLKSAMAFERLIKFNRPKGGGDEHLTASSKNYSGNITWNDVDRIPTFIAQLQTAARHLMEENRYLRKIHQELVAKIVSLMDVDLLREQGRWRETLTLMRCRLAEVANTAGYPADHMRTWLAHLDQQLYKALGVQYRLGLENLNYRMPETNVDLIYQQSQLVFQPRFEEIKAKYYREMRKFMGIPLHFRGVSEYQDKASQLFPLIIGNYSAGFRVCYQKAELLFSRLQATTDIFRKWVVLGNVNLEELIDVQCRGITDYENNFRALKRRGRAIDELPSEIKIDCFTVNCVSVKNTIEHLLHNMFDALLNCLRRSIQADMVTADAFLSDALDKLSVRPQTMDEMAEARENHVRLTREQSHLSERLVCVEEKDKLLRNVAGSGASTFSKTKAKWSEFQLMMDSFKLMMDEQLEVLKSNLDSRTKAFLSQLERFSAHWQCVRPSNDLLESEDRSQCLAAAETIKSQKEELAELEKTLSEITRDYSYFQIPAPDFNLIEELRSNLAETEATWIICAQYSSELLEIEKEHWISFRAKLYVFDEFLTKWSDQLKKNTSTFVTACLMKEIDRYKDLLPVLKWVRDESLSPDHWVELFRLFGLPRGQRLDDLTLGSILSVAPQVIANADALKALTQRAKSEVVIREVLQELDVWAAGAVFLLTPYTDCRGRSLKIVKDWHETITQIGDNQALLASLQGSPCIGSFADRLSAWKQRLVKLDASLCGLQAVQRRWVYLEPIFGLGALKDEASRFNRVDIGFRTLMSAIEADNRVVNLVKGRRENELEGILTNMQEQLTRCQRALNKYLEEKRDLLPRFYFLGNDDLLEMLGQAANLTVIRAHLRKLFQAINDIKVQKEGNAINIVGFCSKEGELVPLKKPVGIGNEVEMWLQSLEIEMRSTLANSLTECLQGYSDFSSYSSQILTLREAIQFSEKVEKAIQAGKLTQLYQELQVKLKSYSRANMQCQRAKMEPSSSESAEEFPRVLSTKLAALILDTGHNIDVVDHLIKQTITSIEDWAWQKQLRFYSPIESKESAPRICMANSEFHYTFEYQGNSPRLVHTPLTDKCYLTLTQALQMGLGGNPYGPAGTGKTESVKQLGALFGRLVLIFNCNEGIDVESMGRIFVGLVKCGAWGCFDEFNRLEEAVLSAVSMQIQVIQNGLRSNFSTVELLGRSVNLSPTASIFITMNPAGKGYGGRQKLPGNLKQLFRPVAMTRPDNDLIAETLLFSQGFIHGRELGKKLVAVFAIASQILSVQQHYDWGLRALKSVLHHAGILLHQTPDFASSENAQNTLDMETRLIIQSVRTCSLAKLTYSDAVRFEALMRDVFPDSKHYTGNQESGFTKKLMEAVHEVLKENHLEVLERQVSKILETHSLITQRMGVVIVGSPGCGKSTILYVLWMALKKLNVRINRHILNPKALPRTNLLGLVDHDTREWTDGVLTRIARDVAGEPVGITSWIICDGDIDPEWIESLNSVLDDNHLLTLPSGERIRFGGNVNFIFETHDLSCASPATVSRTGVVFISDETLDADTLAKRWLLRQPEEYRLFLADMIDTAFNECLNWVKTKKEYLIETNLIGTIFNGLSHLTGATNRAKFTVGLIRGLGANMPEPIKCQLATKIYEVMGEYPPDRYNPLNVRVDRETESRLVPYSDEICLVNQSLVDSVGADVFEMSATELVGAKVELDVDSRLKPPLVISAHTRYTVDTFRLWLDDPSAQQSFLLVGPEGCGKSLLIEYCLASARRRAQVAVVQCVARTRPNHIIDKLAQYCITLTGSSATGSYRVLRPKEGDRLVLFLRDLNLPKPDKWGSCEVVAFLQQILTYKGYYDTNTLEFIGIESIQIVATLTPCSNSTGLGRFPLSPRLTNLLRVASVTGPRNEELARIFHRLLQYALQDVKDPSSDFSSKKLSAGDYQSLANAMVHIWSQLGSTFGASGFPHCNFSLRDLTHWVMGMMRYDLTAEIVSGNLWASFGNEARRLFRDRMPGEEYRQKFDRLFTSLLNGNSGHDMGFDDWNAINSKPIPDSALAVKFATGDPIAIKLDDEITDKSIRKGQHWFVSWDSPEPVSKVDVVRSHEKALSLMSYSSFHKLVAASLKQLTRESYSQTGDLVIFPDFLDQIARIDRVLSRPYGNILLVGRCGIGRRSALRVVLHLHHFKVYTLRMGQNYTKHNFSTDLKAACQSAGVDGLSTVLLLEDYQLIHDIILETINSVVSCGEAPGLISVDDIEALISSEGVSLREAAAEAGYAGPLVSFFAKRVHANLHVVILLDIDNDESLIARLQANPSLYKYCEVCWLDKWSPGGQFLLPQLLVPTLPEGLHQETFSRACLAIHTCVPHARLSSPRRFTSLCATYRNLYTRNRSQLESQLVRFKTGLTKLDEAKHHVNRLKMNAASQERQLREKQAEADKALAGISSAMQGAGKQRAEMEALQRRAAVEATELKSRKVAIDAEMAQIGPILQEARAAVGNIRPEALSEVRALRAPPDVIRDILEGVLLIMGVRDTSWSSMRSFLARRGVQEDIRNFDARRITPELRRNVEMLLKKNTDSFSPKAARRASIAAAPLASWVHANVQYARVLEKVAPLENEQISLQDSLEATQNELQRLNDDLASVDARVAELRCVFESHAKAAADLQNELSKAKHTISIAENLIMELETEHGRWEREVDILNDRLEALPATALMAAGFITYLSACSEDVRHCTVMKWWQQLKELEFHMPVGGPEFKPLYSDFKHFLVTEKEQLQWKSQGLPSDSLSVENAAVILQSTLFPFIIGPSEKIITWLKVQLKDQQVEVTDQRSPNFVTVLELAIRFGKALIIQEIDQIGPIMFPLLRRDFTLRGSRETVRLGEKEVDYNDNFRLYMTTRQPSVSMGAMRPECAASLVTVVNFQTTSAGLVGQLLDITLQHERAELETRRLELIKGEETKRMELAQLEDKLLEDLVNARGNILENTDLLDSLNKTKHSSITVSHSLAEFELLQTKLANERREFSYLAEGASRLFFALNDLVKINNMYQFSLNSFLVLFHRALESPCDSSFSVQKKLSFLLKRLETLFVEQVLRALFKVDRLTFLMHLVHCLHADEVTEDDWNLFINDASNVCRTDADKLPTWIPPDRVAAMSSLMNNQPALFKRLHLNNSEIWSRWLKSDEAECGNLPAALGDVALTDFQKVLVVQALQPAALYQTMNIFTKRTLDLSHSSSSSSISLLRLFINETSCHEPILLITSPGADPSQELTDAAAASASNLSERRVYHEVAMGQGQSEVALAEITTAARTGGWVCLKNLHLVIHWLPILEKHINSLMNVENAGESQSSHPDFRLWLTAEPHNNFPPTLLQSCLKVAYETPAGLRNNLKRTYESWNADFISKDGSLARATALAGLAWFHAVLQERRSFIPQSWTKFYEFSLVDIRAAAKVIDRLFASSSFAPSLSTSKVWQTVRGLLGGAIYGGRIDNAYDFDVLESLLNQIFSDSTLSERQLGSFKLPKSTDLKDYVAAIDKLSDKDDPRDLGLPVNIGKTAHCTAAKTVLNQLRTLQHIAGSPDQNDRSLWAKELAPILALWKKLNQDNSLLPKRDSRLREILSRLEEKSLRDPRESPILSFLHREMTGALNLIATIHNQLGLVAKFIRGTQVLSRDLDALIHALSRGEAPSTWLILWNNGPDDLSRFIKSTIAKTLALQKWLQRAESFSKVFEARVTYDLADLFNPSIFLNALRQQTARQLEVTVNQLKLVSIWPSAHQGLERLSSNPLALTITNMKLEGAIFEDGKLIDCQASSSTVSDVPDIQIAWEACSHGEEKEEGAPSFEYLLKERLEEEWMRHEQMNKSLSERASFIERWSHLGIRTLESEGGIGGKSRPCREGITHNLRAVPLRLLSESPTSQITKCC